jgi:hypothetical protein
VLTSERYTLYRSRLRKLLVIRTHGFPHMLGVLKRGACLMKNKYNDYKRITAR